MPGLPKLHTRRRRAAIVLSFGDFGDFAQRIDRTGDDGADSGHDGDGHASSFAVGGNRGLKSVRPHPEILVDRYQA